MDDDFEDLDLEEEEEEDLRKDRERELTREKKRGRGRPRKVEYARERDEEEAALLAKHGRQQLPDDNDDYDDDRKPKSKPGKNWLIQHSPEVFRVVNPATREVIAEALTIEELRLQLAVISAQHSVEGAKNTR